MKSVLRRPYPTQIARNKLYKALGLYHINSVLEKLDHPKAIALLPVVNLPLHWGYILNNLTIIISVKYLQEINDMLVQTSKML